MYTAAAVNCDISFIKEREQKLRTKLFVHKNINVVFNLVLFPKGEEKKDSIYIVKASYFKIIEI